MRMNAWRRMVAAAGAAVALLVAGCATPVRGPDVDAQYKTVTVVSMLDENIEVRKLGLTIFNNDARPLGRDVGLNALAVSTVEQRLRQARPQWSIVPSQADAQALAARVTRPAFAAPYSSEVKSELAAIAKRTGADALFVVGPTSRDSGPASGRGPGLTVLAVPGVNPRLDVHAYVEVILVDRQGEMVTNRWPGDAAFKSMPAASLGLTGDLATLDNGDTRERLAELLRSQVATALGAAVAHLGY